METKSGVIGVYYPISIDEIKAIVAKKNGRKRQKPIQNNLSQPECLDNVKEITNEYGEKITRVDGDIPVDLPIRSGDRFLFISYDQTILSHGLHKYPAKFFPELPRWLIKKYSHKNSLVLDPFSGSGTTNVEALLCSRNSVGIDIDPFSCFLSKVKITSLDSTELKETQKSLFRSIVNYRPSKVKECDIPDFPYRDNCTRNAIRKKLNKRVYPADALKKIAEAILINVPKMIEFSQNCPMEKMKKAA
jgi:16S rRNA G966 N2-methylase RsmD